jgi:hypothetical protein
MSSGGKAVQPGEACPRPQAGSVVQQPAELVSQDGELIVTLAIRLTQTATCGTVS